MSSARTRMLRVLSLKRMVVAVEAVEGAASDDVAVMAPAAAHVMRPPLMARARDLVRIMVASWIRAGCLASRESTGCPARPHPGDRARTRPAVRTIDRQATSGRSTLVRMHTGAGDRQGRSAQNGIVVGVEPQRGARTSSESGRSCPGPA